MAYPHLDSRPDDDPSAGLIRVELDRILASELFTRSERLSAFLKFIVEETLAGHGDSLKEQVIATELYGKGADFNTAADPIVRVDARRLRDRLREYYATARERGVVISVPKGSYTPVFHGNGVGFPHDVIGANTQALSDADAVAIPRPPAIPISAAVRRSRPWWIAAVAVALSGAALWTGTHLRSTGGSEPTRLLTVTSLPGAEEDPSLSPDGNWVAFSWDGGAAPDANHDIWIKSVDGDEKRQLTNTPDAMEKWPEWSPDGRYVAFTRYIKGKPSIVIASALGGSEQRIGEGRDATWAPDGRSLVLSSLLPNERFVLVQHVLDTGIRRQLTEPPPGLRDIHPRVSPDGKTLAFTRTSAARSALLLVPMSGGEPTTLYEWRSGVGGGLAWTPDGQEILYVRPDLSGRRLVRVSVDGRRPTVPVPGIPYESLGPSVSRPVHGAPYRLAINSGQPDIGLRMVDLQAPREGTKITQDSPFCDSTRSDIPGRFSPDGSRVAFTSDRSGSYQVWVAKRDGSSLQSVTQLKDATVSLGSWSPDGGYIAFDATRGETTHIYVVPASGGPIRQLTDGRASEIDPEWSRDGRWIYYASSESGQFTIWKIPSGGGPKVQVTSEAGYEPRQSRDGSLYFIDRSRVLHGLGPGSTLKRIVIEGGPAEVVDVSVMPGAWEATDAGILFIAARPSLGDNGLPDVLQFYDFAERRVRTLGELAFRVAPFGTNRFLTVSRDGRWVLAPHVDRWERDILVVDNFR